VTVTAKDFTKRIVDECRSRAAADVEREGYGDNLYPIAFGSLSACYRQALDHLLKARAKLDDKCWEAQRIDDFLKPKEQTDG